MLFAHQIPSSLGVQVNFDAMAACLSVSNDDPNRGRIIAQPWALHHETEARANTMSLWKDHKVFQTKYVPFAVQHDSKGSFIVGSTGITNSSLDNCITSTIRNKQKYTGVTSNREFFYGNINNTCLHLDDQVMWLNHLLTVPYVYIRGNTSVVTPSFQSLVYRAYCLTSNILQ